MDEFGVCFFIGFADEREEITRTGSNKFKTIIKQLDNLHQQGKMIVNLIICLIVYVVINVVNCFASRSLVITNIFENFLVLFELLTRF